MRDGAGPPGPRAARLLEGRAARSRRRRPRRRYDRGFGADRRRRSRWPPNRRPADRVGRASRRDFSIPLLQRGATTIDVIEEGDGAAVVLLHGSVSGNGQWRRLVETLAARWRCLAPNLLGYGQTSPWQAARPQTLDDAAAVVRAVCETVDGGIRIVGHSWGGAVALAVAHALGDRVSHLALYEPMCCGLLHGHGREAAWAEALAVYAAVRRHGDAGDWDTLAGIFTDYFNGDGTWAATPAERRRTIASRLPPNRHEWDAAAVSRTARDFAGITARTLVLRGTRTRQVTRETAALLCEAYPHWELHDVEGAGHMGPLTHAADVNARIEAFLGT